MSDPEYEHQSNRIDELNKALAELEDRISAVVEEIKGELARAPAFMLEGKTYFLNGIQAGTVVKSYLLTNKGIEVPGEGPVEIAEFVDSVMRFANNPKRKIEVLSDLENHLVKIRQLPISEAS